MTWTSLFADFGLTIATGIALRDAGVTTRMLTAAVRAHQLIRVRRDRYALPGTDRHVLRAVRVGGRITCDTALRHYGVFGFDWSRTHIHLPRQASRPRAPTVRRAPLTQPIDGALTHWNSFVDPTDGSEFAVGLVDALACTALCGHPHHAIASLDNALFLRKATEDDVATVFSRLPERLQHLRSRINGRTEAGQETVLRLECEDAGLNTEIQVEIPGVGRVDSVVEGRLIFEADSRLAHEGWEQQVRDRERDLAAARLGYMTLRPPYESTMYRTSEVVAAAVALLAATRRR